LTLGIKCGIFGSTSQAKIAVLRYYYTLQAEHGSEEGFILMESNRGIHIVSFLYYCIQEKSLGRQGKLSVEEVTVAIFDEGLGDEALPLPYRRLRLYPIKH
jgi:hypothetical protein